MIVGCSEGNWLWERLSRGRGDGSQPLLFLDQGPAVPNLGVYSPMFNFT
jgi:hypothetical protein